MLVIASLIAVFAVAAALMADAAAYNLIAWQPMEESGGWRRWFPREEVAPKLRETPDEGGMLIVGGGGLDYCVGGWERKLGGLEAGQAFAVHAEVECEGLADVPRSLWMRIYWSGDLADGTAPEVIGITKTGEGRYAFDERVVVPEGARGATLRVIYRWEPDGRAVWRNMSMVPAGPEPAHRAVRIATIYWRPKEKSTIEKNLAAWLKMVDKAAKEKPDFIVMSEGIPSIGIGLGDLDAVSERVPGGAFYTALAEKARKYNAHICYGTYERDGRYIFNTAALIDREGRLIGKYRKSHLPLEEDTAGLAPGNALDVFDTDVCRVGIAICFETEFPEVMRTLALKGAEMIFVPIWGGFEATVRVRASENGVVVVTASYDLKCMIIDRRGNVLAETWKGIGDGVAAATVDLDDRSKMPWTGYLPAYIKRIRFPEMCGEIARETRRAGEKRSG